MKELGNESQQPAMKTKQLQKSYNELNDFIGSNAVNKFVLGVYTLCIWTENTLRKNSENNTILADFIIKVIKDMLSAYHF